MNHTHPLYFNSDFADVKRLRLAYNMLIELELDRRSEAK
jgi:hypothetical protein